MECVSKETVIICFRKAKMRPAALLMTAMMLKKKWKLPIQEKLNIPLKYWKTIICLVKTEDIK